MREDLCHPAGLLNHHLTQGWVSYEPGHRLRKRKPWVSEGQIRVPSLSIGIKLSGNPRHRHLEAITRNRHLWNFFLAPQIKFVNTLSYMPYGFWQTIVCWATQNALRGRTDLGENKSQAVCSTKKGSCLK